MIRVKILVALSLLLVPAFLYAQHSHNAAAGKGSGMTTAQKIANAMSAAPESVSKNATILDWADTPNGQPKELRKGTNSWVCFPNTPRELVGAAGDDPMCIDKEWQSWAQAWMSKTAPKVTGSGLAYMLRGDRGVSNTDPYATAPTPDNHWVVAPPHVMVLYSDLKMLDGFPTDPMSGGPWVMWKGTPYAHLMVPVSSTKAASMPKK